MKNNKKAKVFKVIAIIAGVLVLLGAIAVHGMNMYTGKLVANGIFYQNATYDTAANSRKMLEKWDYDVDSFFCKYTETMITFEAEDGNVVPAGLFEGEVKSKGTSSRPVVILVHGAGGDHTFMYPVADIYLEQGYKVIAIDQRACGASTNDKVSFGHYESMDVKAAVDYAKNELNADCIVIHGQSMGGLTTIVYSATEHANANVDAFIFDSNVYGMEYLFRDSMKSEGLDETAIDYITFCGDRYLNFHYGFGFDDLEATTLLKNDRVPTIMIHATEDDLVTKDQVDTMYESIAAEKKELLSYPCYHIESVLRHKQECSDAIFSFIEQNKRNGEITCD